MNVLLVGKGGREDAIAWKLSQSPKLTKLVAAPGSPGIARFAECVDIDVMDVEGIVALATSRSIDLAVIGPEDPLDAGIVDALQAAGIRTFGPSQKAAQLEADKDFALDMMHRHGIPTGKFKTFTDAESAKACLQEWGAPVVLKASGLAAGKGAVVCMDLDYALATVDDMLVARSFGDAGSKLVVMEYLEGEEASIFGFTDGKDIVYLATSQDHKRIGDGDTGLNTGGMGAYAPAPVVTPELDREIRETIMEPTVAAMAKEGRPYVGILYGGIIATEDGPKVIEFNCRLGDPETQVVLPLLKSDLLDIMVAGAEGTMKDVSVELDDRAACCVVLASEGYPGSYDTGFPIEGISEAEAQGDVVVFHAGTKKEGDTLLTNGGRVLGVTAIGPDIAGAIERTYRAADAVKFSNCYMRLDIGHRALSR